MKMAIVIPHYYKNKNSSYTLSQALGCIQKYEPTMAEHTYVILDPSGVEGSFEETLKVTARFNVKLLEKPERKGFSSVVNYAYLNVINNRYDAMVLMNNDVEITTPFVDVAIKLFDELPRLTVIGALLLYPTGKIQAAGFEVMAPGTVKEYDKNSSFGIHGGDYSKARYVPGVTAAFQIIRSVPFFKMGLYNPHYKMGFEDVEFCYRCWARGGHVLYTPAITAIHLESATRGKVPSTWEVESYSTFASQSADWAVKEVKEKVDTLNRQLDNLRKTTTQEHSSQVQI